MPFVFDSLGIKNFCRVVDDFKRVSACRSHASATALERIIDRINYSVSIIWQSKFPVDVHAENHAIKVNLISPVLPDSP